MVTVGYFIIVLYYIHVYTSLQVSLPTLQIRMQAKCTPAYNDISRNYIAGILMNYVLIGDLKVIFLWSTLSAL